MAASTTQNLFRRNHIIMGTMEGTTTTSIMVMTIMVEMEATREMDMLVIIITRGSIAQIMKSRGTSAKWSVSSARIRDIIPLIVLKEGPREMPSPTLFRKDM